MLKKQKILEMKLVTIEEEKKKWEAREALEALLKVLIRLKDNDQVLRVNQDEETNPMSSPEFEEFPETLFGCRASDIERYARIVFPLLFFTFHMVYWTILMNVSDITIEGLVPLKMKKGGQM